MIESKIALEILSMPESERTAYLDTTKCCVYELYLTIKKTLEVFEELETLKNYYPPFRLFLEEMFERGHNEDLTNVKEWLENEKK